LFRFFNEANDFFSNITRSNDDQGGSFSLKIPSPKVHQAIFQDMNVLTRISEGSAESEIKQSLTFVGD
jgi:hypothetical protein